MTVFIEIICALCILTAIAGTIWHRIKKNAGIGVRCIQFIAVTTITPAVIILALEKIIDGGVVAALFGALLGYLFVNISNFDKDKEEDKEEDKKKKNSV